MRKARSARSYPFTFHEDGFYETLKRRFRNELPKLSKKPILKSAVITDILLVTYIFLFLFAVKFESIILAVISGLNLTVMSIAAHNYFHKKDSLRMYYFDLTMMQFRYYLKYKIFVLL